jgi:hypothetical protein
MHALIQVLSWIRIRIQLVAEYTDLIRIQTKIYYEKIGKNLLLENLSLNSYRGRSYSSNMFDVPSFFFFWGPVLACLDPDPKNWFILY